MWQHGPCVEVVSYWCSMWRGKQIRNVLDKLSRHRGDRAVSMPVPGHLVEGLAQEPKVIALAPDFHLQNLGRMRVERGA